MHIDLQLLQSVGIYLLIGLGVLNRCWPAIRAAASVAKGLTRGAWHAFLTGGISRDRVANWAFFAGVVLLAWNLRGDARPPQPSDCLSEAYTADRVERVAMLRELATLDLSDAQKAEWHLEHSREVIQKAFKPYLDALAVHLHEDTVQQFADELGGAK